MPAETAQIAEKVLILLDTKLIKRGHEQGCNVVCTSREIVFIDHKMRMDVSVCVLSEHLYRTNSSIEVIQWASTRN